MTAELTLSLCTLLGEKVEPRPSLLKQLPSSFIPATEWGLYCHHPCVHSASSYVTGTAKQALCRNTELDTSLLLFGLSFSSPPTPIFSFFFSLVLLQTVLHFILSVFPMGSVMAMWFLKGRISVAFSSS